MGLRCDDVISMLGPKTQDPEGFEFSFAIISRALQSDYVWEYLETLVTLFNGCDSILIETPVGSVSGYESQTWGCFVRMMTGAIGNRRREARSLGSIIIGNDMGKYWGLRRLGDIPVARCVEPDFWMWNSIGLIHQECVRMLRSGGLS